MNSINFPDMFNGTRTNIATGSTAVLQTTRLLLESCRGMMIGDPYFGSKIKRYIYEQNNIILRDIIIDDILVLLQTFIPQIDVKRNDIVLTSDKQDIYANISCINKLDNQPNLFQIRLTTD